MYIYIFIYIYIYIILKCSTLVPFCPFIRHPVSKFTLRPCEENASDNEDFRSTIFQPFKFDPEQSGNESHEKETKHLCFSCRFITD